jgi:ribose transport system permease protein
MSHSPAPAAKPLRGSLLAEAAWQAAAFAGGYLLLSGSIYVTTLIGNALGLPWFGLVGLAIFIAALAALLVRMTAAGNAAAGTLGPLLALLCVILFFAAADFLRHRTQLHLANFWSLGTLTTAAAQTCIVAVAALGMTIIIIAGGIDLSVGTALALAATVAAWVIDEGYGFHAGVAAGIMTGIVTGMVNGQLISYLNVVPFIITLGTMSMYLGIGKLIAAETTVRPPLAERPEFFRDMLAQFPDPAWVAWPLVPNLAWGVWVVLLLALGVAALLHYTVFGRHVFAVGSNEMAAKMSGINVPLVRILVYSLAGLFVGLAGIYQFGRLFQGSPTSGQGLELRVIAAVVIGGGSLSGGRGSIVGTLCGAALMQTIQSGCAALNVSNPVQDILIGAIIVAAVTLDQYREGKLTSENVMTVIRGLIPWR